MKEKCIASDCDKCIKKELPKYIIVPFECENLEMRKLFSFFLYRAPNIMSVHSKKLNSTNHSIIFNRMIEERHFKYQKFCGANAIIENELNNAFLNGNDVCLKCKRFVCKRKRTYKGELKETDLDCFLRHIRNAIAHGRVYYCHAGNRVHIFFEDENSPGKLSARIVCIKADLEHWKKILSDKRYY